MLETLCMAFKMLHFFMQNGSHHSQRPEGLLCCPSGADSIKCASTLDFGPKWGPPGPCSRQLAKECPCPASRSHSPSITTQTVGLRSSYKPG